MRWIDVRDETLWEVNVKEKGALFTRKRVDKESIPHGIYCYELRHDEDDTYPVTMEHTVGVNYFGAVLSTEPLLMAGQVMNLGAEDFGYTGLEKQIYEIMKREPALLQGAPGLLLFIDENGLDFRVTEQEAGLLLGYLENHSFVLGEMDGCLYRGDLSYQEGKTKWSSYSMDDLIDSVTEWNYEMICTAEDERNHPKDFVDFVQNDNYLEQLRKDEEIFDRLFEQTKYNTVLDIVAEKLAAELISGIQAGMPIEWKVRELAGEVKQASARIGAR